MFLDAVRLSERLSVVASFVEREAVVADIGSDHAYLPTYLVKKGIVRKAIAGEVVAGPYESALRNVQKEGVANAVTVRLADGLSAIEEQDGVDTVTIAGMGGPLIASILENGKDRLHTVKRIIAQPNIHAKSIREWAVANGWELRQERILKEDKKIYEVLVLERGIATYDELELLVGPFLLAEKSDIFQEKWTNEIAEWHQIVLSMDKAEKTPAVLEKKEQLMRVIHLVGKVLGK